MTALSDCRGVLLDIDGTLIVGDRAVEGAAETLSRLRAAGLAVRLFTNTTRRSRAAIARGLCDEGLEVEADEILTPAILARRRIVDSGRTRAALLVAQEARVEFDGVTLDEERPDWLVMGDLGPGFSWDTINRAFGWLRGGAGFLALQKNRFWFPDGRTETIDAGGFVAALEFASGVTAEVVGKPSPEFFRLALESAGTSAGQTLVVGDDPTTDGRGAARAGCRVALVRTGKFGSASPADEEYTPDAILDTIAELRLD
ncbi:MAG: HAD-IIA family hydrolase [bacterium]|nr:HAD-IIA family hydrolase [bacterium]